MRGQDDTQDQYRARTEAHTEAHTLARPARRAIRCIALATTTLLAACAGLRYEGPGPNHVAPAPAATAAPATATAPSAIPDRTTLIGLVNRATWGVTPTTLREVEARGWQAWFEDQLRPRDDGLPEAVRGAIAAMRISQESYDALMRSTTYARLGPAGLGPEAGASIGLNIPSGMTPEQRQAALEAYNRDLNELAREASSRSLLRAIHSRNQLHEQMSWFWMNHFSVFQGKANVRGMMADYEDHAIRPYALGRFRDMLGAVARHPAMLRFLDNDRNAAGRINENLGRELLELHTLGVDGGYTQQDVQELARILTGVGVAALAGPNLTPRMAPRLAGQYVREGLFEFNPARHDYGDKTLLGVRIAGRGLAELDQALDLMARHPATARFIARKLASHFVADNPPAELVARMAARFTATDGDIAAVVREMFASREMRAALGTKFKDPQAWVVSAVRLVHDGDGAPPVLNMTPLLGLLNNLGEPLRGRRTPDGWPLTAEAWSGSGQMNARFEAARALAAGPPALRGPDAPQRRSPTPRLADSPVVQALTPTLAPATRLALAQAANPYEWNTLFLAAPEMMHR